MDLASVFLFVIIGVIIVSIGMLAYTTVKNK